MKNLLLVAIILLGSFNLYAQSDSEAAARALEDRLRDALVFDNGQANNVHRDTKLRRFEDGNPMWLQLYVRPQQNKRFRNYFAKGFKTGRNVGLFTNITNISSRGTFHMRHESPWSYKLSGIGKFLFYHKAGFKEQFRKVISSNDRPKYHTFGSGNNAARCRCSQQNPSCARKTCGKREIIGSVKFCPGVSVYAKKDYIGTPMTYSMCDAKPKSTKCFRVATAQKKMQSFHFDALLSHVKFYTGPNCKGGTTALYSFAKQKGTVPLLTSSVRNKVGSIRIYFRNID